MVLEAKFLIGNHKQPFYKNQREVLRKIERFSQFTVAGWKTSNGNATIATIDTIDTIDIESSISTYSYKLGLQVQAFA